MITTHGIPLSLYRDRHSIFQRNDAHWTLAEQLAGKQTPTQLGRALKELGIQQIPAYSPQAKGRIERAWRTCQDRLVSELRLARATTVAASQRRARPLPRRLSPALCPPRRPGRSAIFAPCPAASISPAASVLRYQRVVAADHVITLGAHSIALPPLPAQRGYAGETVELSHQLDGTLRVYRGDQLLLAQPLPLEEYSDRRPAPRTTAQKRKTHDAPHLQPLRPSGFSGRYLNDKGVTESRCS